LVSAPCMTMFRTHLGPADTRKAVNCGK